MASAWLVFFFLVVAACLALISMPLFKARVEWDAPREETELDRLLREKALTLRALKDLDHERQTGLVDESGYETIRSQYVERAVALNRRIGEISGVDPSVPQVFA